MFGLNGNLLHVNNRNLHKFLEVSKMTDSIYEVDLILPQLTSPEGESLFQTITRLYHRDSSKIDINIDFLAKFPQLTEFNGRLLLQKPSELESIAKLNYRILILDLNHLIQNVMDCDKIIYPHRTLILRNLVGTGGVDLKIHRGGAEFILRDDTNYSIRPWAKLLSSENIHHLNTRYCHEDFLSNLPANIEQLELAEPLSANFEPLHPLSLIGKLEDWHGSHISEKIHQVNLPLRQDPEQLLVHNSHLHCVGYYPDLEHISLFKLIDKIDRILGMFQGNLIVWVPSRATQVFLKKKLMNPARVHVSIVNW